MKSRHTRCSSIARLNSGFSLIELMVAIALGLLILAGMALVFSNSSATRNEIDRTNRQIENGRYAMELLRDDLQLAAFFGEIDMAKVLVTASMPASIPDPCATTLTERTFNTTGNVPGILSLPVQGVNNYSASAAAPDNLSCLTGANAVKPGTDVIVVRRVKTCIAGAAGCDVLANGKPYLQTSLCTTPPTVAASTTVTHALAIYPSPTEFVHKLKDCTTAAPLRPYVIYLYFVGTDNILKRAEFTGTVMGNVTSLVDGIENLQVDYGVDRLDTDPSTVVADGNANEYRANPVSIANWQNVVTVQINLLARNTEVSPGYSDTKTYNLGPSAGSVGPFNDGFRRHVYSSLVRIQNVSARRETP